MINNYIVVWLGKLLMGYIEKSQKTPNYLHGYINDDNITFRELIGSKPFLTRTWHYLEGQPYWLLVLAASTNSGKKENILSCLARTYTSSDTACRKV